MDIKEHMELTADGVRRMNVAVNKPVGDNARKGAVKKRSQVKTKLGGATAGPSEARTPASSWR